MQAIFLVYLSWRDPGASDLVAASTAVMAREGVQKTSIGNGMKCWQASVVQADGSVKRQQVCGKYGV